MGSAGQVRGQASLASFGEHGLGCPGVQEWRKGVGWEPWGACRQDADRECLAVGSGVSWDGQLEVRAKGAMSHKPEVTSARLGGCSQGPPWNTFFPKELQEERGIRHLPCPWCPQGWITRETERRAWWGFAFLLILTSLCGLYGNSHSNKCEATSHCYFDLTLPLWFLMLMIFSCAYWPYEYLLWKKVYSYSLFFKSCCFLFWCWIVCLFCTFYILTPCQIYHFQISSLLVSGLFVLLMVSFVCKAFNFDVVPLVFLFVCFSCLRRHIPPNNTIIDANARTTCFSLEVIVSFMSYI